MRTFEFAGIPVLDTSSEQLTRELIASLAGHEARVLLFANANFIVQCRAQREWLAQPKVTVVNDGVAMALAARLFHRAGFQENLNGTDYCPRLLAALPARTRVFLLGGRPGVAGRVAGQLDSGSELVVAGHADGYGELAADGLIERINTAGTQVLLVALGNPRQEQWIQANLEHLQVPLVVGVGALLDFMSGTVPRAPSWMRALHAEWLFRLFLEPRRLLKRYTVDIVRFLWYCNGARQQT